MLRVFRVTSAEELEPAFTAFTVPEILVSSCQLAPFNTPTRTYLASFQSVAGFLSLSRSIYQAFSPLSRLPFVASSRVNSPSTLDVLDSNVFVKAISTTFLVALAIEPVQPFALVMVSLPATFSVLAASPTCT